VKVIVVLVVVASVALGCFQAAAFEERPPLVFPPAPAPSECVVTPVDASALQPSAEDASTVPLVPPEEPISPLSLFPNSESAGSEARKEIEALERQLAACYNAGDWRRAASLYTHSYLDRIVAASGDRVYEFFPSEREPLDRLNWLNVLIEDVRRVDDGRLAALVHYCSHKQVHYYRQEADGWRLDDSIDVHIEDETICMELDPTAVPAMP
jgi:hypothetical protein